ncbi:Cholesterol 7-alpha-monooxygenase [Seminavis robusta]|uniref:Cholesterol 7-alpha-monooxygenase n=1 Tax=Seminavis robusta TaxID=568900 RepID=A0A9N8EPF5_9STRA|nr:Cholesterol 7-alpha-monooxygenase [Seminavis robusta]|eukprot:Sro1336_g264050.1 Cholesterol 7-alpha-monooxygenase (535) ;mRNA; f:21736-23340
MDLLQSILNDWDSHNFLQHGLKDWESLAHDAVVLKVTALIISTVVFAYLFYGKKHNKDNKSAPKAPWVFWSWVIPFLPMVQMGMDHRKYFKEWQQKYGKAYRFRLGPHMMPTTCIHDNSFSAMTGRYPDIYKMYDAVKDSGLTIFLRRTDKMTGKAVMEELGTILHSKVVSLWQDQNYLEVYCTRLVNEFSRFLSNDAFFTCSDNCEWKTAHVNDMMHRMMFIATTRGILGNYDQRLESDEMYSMWWNFDSMVPLLAIAGQFEFLFRSTRKGQDEFARYLRSLPVEDQTDFFKALTAGLPMTTSTDLLFLFNHVSHANTGPAIFWIMFRLLRDKKEREEVLAELHDILGEEQGWSPSSSDAPEINYSVVKKLKQLKSYIKDVLRLYSGAWLLRRVMEDQTVTLENGEQIFLPKGENIVCVNPHFDEAMFPEPHRAKTSRFLPNARIKDAQGKDVKLPTMTFGHGTHKCPGENGAYVVLATTVAFMFSRYELELINPSTEVEPQPDYTRVAFGTMPLDMTFHDHESLQFRFRSKY